MPRTPNLALALTMIIACLGLLWSFTNVNGQHHPLPQVFEPIRAATISLNTDSVWKTAGSGSPGYFAGVAPLSSNSTRAADGDGDSQVMYPFGKRLSFQFQTGRETKKMSAQGVDESNGLIENHDDPDSQIRDTKAPSPSISKFKGDPLLFHLNIDESPIFGSGSSNHRVSTIDGMAGPIQNDQNDQHHQPEDPSPHHQQQISDTKAVSTHTSFRGGRYDDDGNFQTILLTIMPKTLPSPTTSFETQQDGIPSLDSGFGDQYTIEGVLILGRVMYRITTFETLIGQTKLELENAKQALEKVSSGNEDLTPEELVSVIQQQEDHIDQLNKLLVQLSEQRLESSHDLVLVELGSESDGICGTGSEPRHIQDNDENNTEDGSADHNDKSDEIDDQNNHTPTTSAPTPAPMKPQDTPPEEEETAPRPPPNNYLEKWRADCHPYMDRIVVFSLRIFASYGYAQYASNSLIPDPARVDAHIKLIFQQINKVTSEQFSVIWKVVDVVIGTKDGEEEWNTLGSADPRCNLASADADNPLATIHSSSPKALKSLEDMRPDNLDVSAIFGFLYCPPQPGVSTIAGVANLETICMSPKGAASGVASVSSPQAWTTVAHEVCFC